MQVSLQIQLLQLLHLFFLARSEPAFKRLVVEAFHYKNYIILTSKSVQFVIFIIYQGELLHQEVSSMTPQTAKSFTVTVKTER